MSRFRRALFLPLALALLACPPPDRASDDDDDDDASGDDDDATGDDDDATGDDDDDAAGPVATSLDCVGSVAQIESEWDNPGSMTFAAIGRWSDGSSEPAGGAWSIVDGRGTISADGTYTADPRGAGPVTVRIEWEGLFAECSVDTYLEALLDLTADPAIVAALGATPTRAASDCAPYVLYPLDGALIPADFFSPEIQWIPAAGQDTFVITFETTFITVTAVTQDPSWTPEGDAWWAIANPASGTAIDMSVLGGDWDPGSGAFVGGLCGAPWPTALATAEWGAQGSVFYWTPTTSGLWQVDVGTETATPWMDASTTGQCVGCHSINLANPTLLAVTQGSGGYGASVVALDTAPLSPVAGGGREASFSALDPTGTRMVRADRGVLYLDDLSVDANIGTLPTVGWATQPNWSPDGQWVSYASCAGAIGGNDWAVYDCDLRIIEALPGDQWGPDLGLAAAPPGQSYYYPNFSPDSQWVAFNRSSAGADVYDEPTAQLMLMPLSGAPPTLLATAGGLPNRTDSWPRWGPIVGDVGWLAFGSRRPYALRTSGIAQVWVAGVDLSVVAAGQDGSWAPVWLPGQSTTTSNHTPAFIQRVTDPETDPVE